jgi:hypothetical protein
MPTSVDKHAMRRADFDRLDIKHVPCAVCKAPTQARIAKRCDACWEVEHRLVSYLLDGGKAAKRFVIETLVKDPERVETIEMLEELLKESL